MRRSGPGVGANSVVETRDEDAQDRQPDGIEDEGVSDYNSELGDERLWSGSRPGRGIFRSPGSHAPEEKRRRLSCGARSSCGTDACSEADVQTQAGESLFDLAQDEDGGIIQNIKSNANTTRQNYCYA